MELGLYKVIEDNKIGYLKDLKSLNTNHRANLKIITVLDKVSFQDPQSCSLLVNKLGLSWS